MFVAPRALFACLSLLPLAGAAACSSDERPPAVAQADAATGDAYVPPPVESGPITTDGAPDANDATAEIGDASGVCTALDPTAYPDVEKTWVATAKPTPSGGSITPGTWALAKYEQFTGPGGESGPIGLRYRAVIAITTTGFERAFTGSGIGTPVLESGTWSVAGTNVTFTNACPDPFPTTWAYTADATTLVVFEGDEAFTYEKK